MQRKRYRKTLGSEIARELYGTQIHEEAAHASLANTADTPRAWAAGKSMTPIDGNTLAQLSLDLRLTDRGAAA